MIDVHLHYLRPEWAEALWAPERRRASSLWPLLQLRMRLLADPDLCIQALDARGVARGVIYPELSIAPGPQIPGGLAAALALCREMNNTTARLVARYPDRALGLAVVNPLGGTEDLAEMKRAVLALGLRGVAIGASYRGETIAAPVARPFLELAQALDVPVVIHPTADGIWQAPRDFGLDLLVGVPGDVVAFAMRLLVTGALDPYPRLRVVLPHLGFGLPALLGWLEAHTAPDQPRPTERARRFWADAATATPASLALAIDAFGADHILYASDWPLSSAPNLDAPTSDPAALLGKLPLGAEGRAGILAENARRLFG